MWSLALYLSQARTPKPTFPSLPQTWRAHKTAKIIQIKLQQLIFNQLQGCWFETIHNSTKY